MSKGRVIALLLLVAAAVGASVVIAVRVIDRDREQLVQQFSREWLHQVQRAAIELQSDFDSLRDDLQLGAQLVRTADTPGDRERELIAIVTVGRIYRAVQVRDAQNRPALEATASGALGEFDRLAIRAALEEVGAAALAERGAVHVSRPIPLDGQWLRAFAIAPPSQPDEAAVLAAVVDTRPLFAKLNILAADTTARVLVLGSRGRPAPISDERLARALEDPGASRSSDFDRLLRRMRAAQAGSMRIRAAHAGRLGLADAEHVAVYAPIDVPGGSPWSIAMLASTASLREHQAAIVRRMVLIVAGVAVLLIGIAAAVVVAARREVALRERLRHADQLARSEKLATVGVLAAGIAHEIGTPLGVVRGRAEYIHGKLGEVHPQAAGLQVIVEQIDHVTRTIRQLLDFSRERPADARPTSLPQAVRDVVDLLQIEAERRDLQVTADVPADLPLIVADADQLQQVLVNLVINAYDACESGGHVEIAAWYGETGHVGIEVRDDGRGIAADHHHQVFDPFFTTKKRGQGTGLGLTIVSQIVRNHRGTIELASQPGRGTAVTLQWPTAGEAPRRG